ncbi:MAG: hypothetical protein ACI4K9_00650 [Candidatus Fimenecus sp.]
MSFARAKIDAQKILLTSRKKALAVCLLGFLLRLICILCTGVSLYSLLHLTEYALATQSVYAEIGFYALFTIALLLSLWLFALLAFLQKRWFLENAQGATGIASLFCRFRFIQAVKIGFLYYLKKVLSLFDFLFYVLPFGVLSAGLFYELQNGSISRFLLGFSLAFLGVLFLVGIYFGFAAVQKYAFCDALLSLTPQQGLIDTLKTSRKLARQTAFPAVKFKLQFVPWVLCSFLLLPIFYALPYYRQSVACMIKSVLDKNHLTKPAQKPIVFFVQAGKPLQA